EDDHQDQFLHRKTREAAYSAYRAARTGRHTDGRPSRVVVHTHEEGVSARLTRYAHDERMRSAAAAAWAEPPAGPGCVGVHGDPQAAVRASEVARPGQCHEPHPDRERRGLADVARLVS